MQEYEICLGLLIFEKEKDLWKKKKEQINLDNIV